MKSDQRGSQVAVAFLAEARWWYAAKVLYPAQALKRAGVPVAAGVMGKMPLPPRRRGLGVYFSRRYPRPILLRHSTLHDHLVEEFNRVADVYAEFVEPFSRPIFDEALPVIAALLGPDSRVLDAGCGPGREVRRIARLLPRGEVVGIDLASRMVTTAHGAARAAGLDNCAFFQADVGALPRMFAGNFDLVYSCLAHHHYPAPATATASILRCLRPGGAYCVVDPGPAWYNALSAPIARLADPGWIGFHTPEEFQRLLLDTGFVRAGWLDLLPGYGIAIGQKAVRA